MAISLESLFELARALGVPPAYLLATTPEMADAILSLGNESESQQRDLATVLKALTKLSATQRNAFAQSIVDAAPSEEP